MRTLLPALLVAAALASAASAAAQAPPPAAARLRQPLPDPRLTPGAELPATPLPTLALDSTAAGSATAWLVLGGVAGGVVGTFGGMAGGALLDGAAAGDCIDFCFGPALVLGTLGGEAVGVAAGVHLANGRRGNLALGTLASAAILASGLVLGSEVPVLFFALPAAQLGGVIAVERATARAKRRAR